MFIAKKIIASLLLPPGIFLVILFWLGWRLIRKKRRGTGLVLWLLALLIWGLSTAPVATMLLASLERGYAVKQVPQGDVIVLLGGGLHDHVPDLTGRSTPKGEVMGRLITALRAQRQLGVPVIVSGGTVYPGQDAEAPVLRRYLLELGVPADKVIMEDQSRDTADNARLTGVILKQKGFGEPLLVTSAYHMRRSLAAFQQAGVNVKPLAANFQASPLAFRWPGLLPDAGHLNTTAKALREYLGIYWYKIPVIGS